MTTKSNRYELEGSVPLRSDSVWGHPVSLIARSGPKRAPASKREYACFQTEERLYCRDTDCVYRTECIRLVAVWRR